MKKFVFISTIFIYLIANLYVGEHILTNPSNYPESVRNECDSLLYEIMSNSENLREYIKEKQDKLMEQYNNFEISTNYLIRQLV